MEPPAPVTARPAREETATAPGWGTWLRERRLARGLTVRDVGRACGVAHTTAARWETEGAQPGLEVARRLARLLGVSVRELVMRAEGG